MKEYKTLKLDVSFPDYGGQELNFLLSNGWKIIDKTVTGDRYILYVLELSRDMDVGKSSNEPSEIVH